MTWLLGTTLALGALLVASPWLWPKTEAQERARRPSKIRDRLVQAGLDQVPAFAVVLISIVLAVVAAGTALIIVPIVPIALAAGGAGAAAPFAVIAWRARKRRAAQALLWPDVVDHLVSAVRSGLALPDALATLAVSGPTLTRDAFAAYAADYRATGSFSYSIDRLKERLADPVADRIVETLRMARDVGGAEVANVLRELGSFLRSDHAMRSELVARQTWVVQAARLGVVAPWVVLAILAARPEAQSAYNSPGGFAVIVVGAVVTFIAYRFMVSLGRLPEEGRWFA